MKREASVWRKFVGGVSSARKLSAFISVSVVFLSAPIMAQSEGLRFHGKLVNTGCTVERTAARVTDSDVRYLQVSGITVQVRAGRDACGEQAIPFTLHYQLLPVTSLQAGIQNPGNIQTGLLILTYQ
ncbi:hypothetical protein [Pseudomonas cichorii]|uniref:hypothetical protein n=1 Tax=Pseudomonas cichorii TaxID=36746 RepID=UPI001C896A33|nr:hypothetical protein [Pseudomonas cichorii]MBX8487235.1 hypothetical protein [Pseudomonas cichorii]MBX8497507.1 hypothetical protein [Pseudomonas cichorii]MBX8531495.1 hypothetical protein [Pseudomonas cichorii]